MQSIRRDRESTAIEATEQAKHAAATEAADRLNGLNVAITDGVVAVCQVCCCLSTLGFRGVLTKRHTKTG